MFMFSIFSRSFRVIVVSGIIVALLIMGIIYRATRHSDRQKQEQIVWGTSVAATTEPAQRDHKYVLVDVYTDWCSWCKKLDRDVFTDPDLISYLRQDFICVKVNAGDMAEGTTVATSFGVHNYPHALVFSPDGTLVGQVNGYVEAPGYITMLKQIVAESKPDQPGVVLPYSTDN